MAEIFRKEVGVPDTHRVGPQVLKALVSPDLLPEWGRLQIRALQGEEVSGAPSTRARVLALVASVAPGAVSVDLTGLQEPFLSILLAELFLSQVEVYSIVRTVDAERVTPDKFWTDASRDAYRASFVKCCVAMSDPKADSATVMAAHQKFETDTAKLAGETPKRGRAAAADSPPDKPPREQASQVGGL